MIYDSNGKVCRNLQEQVAKNMSDIENLTFIGDDIHKISFSESDYDADKSCYVKTLSATIGYCEIELISSPTYEVPFRIYCPSMLVLTDASSPINGFSGIDRSSSERYIEYASGTTGTQTLVIVGGVVIPAVSTEI